MERALKKAGLAATDLGLVEINEAFASVAIHAGSMLGVDSDIVNVNGGAVALGHPIGMSGARLVLTLAHEMRRRGVEYGGAALCGGGGQGDALIIKRAS
jgi:acetyl-CoA C-acetyltransferase